MEKTTAKTFLNVRVTTNPQNKAAQVHTPNKDNKATCNQIDKTKWYGRNIIKTAREKRQFMYRETKIKIIAHLSETLQDSKEKKTIAMCLSIVKLKPKQNTGHHKLLYPAHIPFKIKAK